MEGKVIQEVNVWNCKTLTYQTLKIGTPISDLQPRQNGSGYLACVYGQSITISGGDIHKIEMTLNQKPTRKPGRKPGQKDSRPRYSAGLYEEFLRWRENQPAKDALSKKVARTLREISRQLIDCARAIDGRGE